MVLLLQIGPPDSIADLDSLKNLISTDDINRAYYYFMVEVAVLLGAERETAETDLGEVYSFEKQIHKVQLL